MMQAPNTVIYNANSETRSEKSGFYCFVAIWLSQFVSGFGVALMNFVLGVWVFQTTRSVTSLALIAVCAMLPRALSSVFAGALVDRHGPRRAIVIGNVGALVSLVPALVLFWNGLIEFWHICVTLALVSIWQSLLWPAVSASIPALLGKKEFVRANGMVQASTAALNIIAPLIGGVVALHFDLGAMLVITIAIYAASIPPLALARIPRAEITKEDAEANSYMSSISDAWAYLRHNTTLLRLTVIFAASSFIIVIASMLVKPLILSFASASSLGTVMSVSALGMLLGALGVAASGKGASNFKQVMLLMVIAGLCMAIGGLRPVVWLIAVATFIYSFTMPIISSGVNTIIQTSAPVHLQGRMNATLTTIIQGSMPLAFLIAGPLADYVFEPLLLEGGPLTSSLGWIIGVGPGRGMALLMIILGSLIVGLSLIGQIEPQQERGRANALAATEHE